MLAGFGIAGASGDGHITIFPFFYDAIGQGTWAWSGNLAANPCAGFWFNSTHADLDNISYKLYLQGGTYNFKAVFNLDTDAGICDVLLDGVSQGTIDTYAGVMTTGQLKSINGIVVVVPGIYTLTLKVNGKNVGSSNHYIRPSIFAMYRTG